MLDACLVVSVPLVEPIESAEDATRRRRYLPDVWSRSKDAKQRALRQAVNTIIQGTAADINKLALVRLHRALPACCRLLLTVHDSVLLEVPEDRAESASRLVRRVMQSPLPEFTVPLAVTVKCGRSWADGRHSAAANESCAA
jgi:DNA polymerase I